MVSYSFVLLCVILILPSISLALVLPKPSGHSDGHHQHSGGHSDVNLRESETPHILFIMVDEMDGRILDPKSDQYQPPMKNVRSLAKGGTMFTMGYTGAPLCTPARASMMTGRYTSDIRVYGNGIGLIAIDGDKNKMDQTCPNSDMTEADCRTMARKQDNDGTFIDVLADAGYGINIYGKLHMGGGLDRFLKNPGDGMSIPSFGGFTGSDARNFAKEWTRATGITNAVGGAAPEHAPMLGVVEVEDKTPAINSDYGTEKKCAQLLEKGLFTNSDPQFLYCSFETPHPEWRTDREHYNRIHMGDKAMPEWEPKESMHPADVYTAESQGSWGIDEVPMKEIEEARHVYFAMCEEADDFVGTLLDALDKGGGRDNSYIIFVSDHGEHAYENFAHGKESLREASARVPIIISGKGVKGRGGIDTVASLHDIYPTIIDMAGTKARAGKLAGESLLPVATGVKQARNKNYIVAEYHARRSGTGEFMLVQFPYKLITYGGPQIGEEHWPPQLFDLRKDPHEFTDLSKKNPTKVQELDKLLRKEMNVAMVDAEKKAWDKEMFTKYYYKKNGGASGCFEAMAGVYHGFNDEDAAKLAAWLGSGCNGGPNGTQNTPYTFAAKYQNQNGNGTSIQGDPKQGNSSKATDWHKADDKKGSWQKPKLKDDNDMVWQEAGEKEGSWQKKGQSSKGKKQGNWRSN